jgi:protein-tyrosine phosphatase
MMTNWLKNYYGSREGFINTKWHQLLYLLGRYRMYEEVPWNSIKRFVFVCSGNICRSAFAEAVAKSRGVDAISTGVHAIEGAPANKQAISTAQAMGYDLTLHRTTPIMYPIFNKTDLLIAMEPWQADIAALNLAQKYHTTLLGIWMKPMQPFIYDPYRQSEFYFK